MVDFTSRDLKGKGGGVVRGSVGAKELIRREAETEGTGRVFLNP